MFSGGSQVDSNTPLMRVIAFLFATLMVAATARAQVNPVPQLPAVSDMQTRPAAICNQKVADAARVPPTSAGPVLAAVMLCFEKQGVSPVVEPNSYLSY